jgi:hypothetical protein
MRNDSTEQSVLFAGLMDKRRVARFDQPLGSSDGGAVLLEASDDRLGLSERFAKCIHDTHQPGKIERSVHDLIRQRPFAIACRKTDCNDRARLADDPIQKLRMGDDPAQGDALASQPALSRLENAVDPLSLYRMAEILAEAVIAGQSAAHPRQGRHGMHRRARGVRYCALRYRESHHSPANAL